MPASAVSTSGGTFLLSFTYCSNWEMTERASTSISFSSCSPIRQFFFAAMKDVECFEKKFLCIFAWLSSYTETHVAPEALLGPLGLDVGIEVLVGVGVRHRQVPGSRSNRVGDVGRSLDRGVATQRQDAAPAGRCCPAAPAGSTPPGCTAPRRCAGSSRRCRRTRWSGPARSWRSAARRPRGMSARDSADLLDHLRGVPGEVPLQHLEHAPRVLQRLVPFGCPRRPARPRRTRVPRPRRLARADRSLGRVLVLLCPVRPDAACTSRPSYCQVRKS